MTAKIRDLRDYIKVSESLGVLKYINGADWDLELGVLSDLYRRRKSTLFDKIKDYPEGYRVFTNIFATEKQQKAIFNAPLESTTLDFVRIVKNKMAEFSSIKPIEVGRGPVMDNILKGGDIDILKFPVPRWHEMDGGRYIGTADLIITRDPDTGWVNLGTYRVMVQNKNTTSSYMSPGRHGRFMREKYWQKGENCPVAVVCGHDPLLFAMSMTSVPFGVSEYEFAGWLKGEPIEVVKGPYTGLPIPASAEIVLEGEMPPPEKESRPEGPFGEWTGYYASGARNEPIIHVKTVLHRNSPILTGVSSGLVPSEVRANVIRSAMLWSQMEQAGVPDINGVWFLEPGGPNLMIAISIKQRFPGHAKQAALAAIGCREGSYLNRFVIVIDDDIDPTNENDVWWAMASRCDPKTSIDIIDNCWASPLDPRLEPARRASGDYSSSRAIINACKPYHWIKDFPKVVNSSSELVDKVAAKYKDILKDLSPEDLYRATRSKVVM